MTRVCHLGDSPKGIYLSLKMLFFLFDPMNGSTFAFVTLGHWILLQTVKLYGPDLFLLHPKGKSLCASPCNTAIK
jgi:hypothetical protein